METNQKLKVVLASLNLRENYSLAFGFLKAYAYADKFIKDSVDIEILNFDINEITENKMSEQINGLNPEIVGFSAYIWNINKIMILAKKLKESNPLIKIILGGPNASPIADEILNNNKQIDIVVRGEGEVTFYEIVKHFLSGLEPLKNIAGITYRDEISKTIITNENQKLIQNLDEIPSPYLEGYINLKDILNTANIETFRGCAFRCAYCFENKGYDGTRFFSSKRVSEELAYLKSNNMREIYFINSTFNADKKKMRELCESISEINKENVLYIIVELKAELIDEDVCQILNKGNISEGTLGLQSVCLETNKNISRWFDRQCFKKGISLLSRYGINFQIHIINGLPGDNFFRHIRTLKFAFFHEPLRIFPFLLTVLPGTGLRLLADKYNIKYEKIPPYNIISNYSFSEDEIKLADICSKSFLKEYLSCN